MAAIDELIQQIQDPSLRERIRAEVDDLAKQKKFGLVFENHLPERTPLYEAPIKVGSLVMPKLKKGDALFTVKAIDGETVTLINKTDGSESKAPLRSIVVAAELGEPIYPYLKYVDSISRAPDDDLWHVLIEADNYHALQLLEYMYAGKVDCIYIDPPYNTGAKDWKYNNDYVDGHDTYRHSKWLSMMEKRLLLAQKLLNKKDSVLIVTIDEKEYLHLGCLLEQIFKGDSIQMITSVINPSGSARKNEFSRAEEYIFFVFVGEAKVYPSESDMIHAPKDDLQVRWASLLRSGSNSDRSARPKLFYPIYFSKETGKFVKAGESLPLEMSKETVIVPEGCFAVWPTKANGQDARWTLSQETLMVKIQKGYAKFGKWKQGDTNRTISYLADGMETALFNGELEILGTDEDGMLITGKSFKPVVPLSVWNQPSHGAGDFGSSLLLQIFKEKRFSFPKSLYAVYDTLKFIVKGKPNALILDFFAGSGTTLHAVNLLNGEDNGHRRCVMVTNNEVSDEESKKLSAAGFYPGDVNWEKYGIAHYVTWPRTVCTIKGSSIEGKPLSGNYLKTDEPMSSGFSANAAFFKLGFLDKTTVALGKQFKNLLPILWMKSGCHSMCPVLDSASDIPDMLVLPENHFAVLTNEVFFGEFSEKVSTMDQISTVFIVTNSEINYKEMAIAFENKQTYQLYRDYLDNFRLNVRK